MSSKLSAFVTREREIIVGCESTEKFRYWLAARIDIVGIERSHNWIRISQSKHMFSFKIWSFFAAFVIQSTFFFSVSRSHIGTWCYRGIQRASSDIDTNELLISSAPTRTVYTTRMILTKKNNLNLNRCWACNFGWLFDSVSISPRTPVPVCQLCRS